MLSRWCSEARVAGPSLRSVGRCRCGARRRASPPFGISGSGSFAGVSSPSADAQPPRADERRALGGSRAARARVDFCKDCSRFLELGTARHVGSIRAQDKPSCHEGNDRDEHHASEGSGIQALHARSLSPIRLQGTGLAFCRTTRRQVEWSFRTSTIPRTRSCVKRWLKSRLEQSVDDADRRGDDRPCRPSHRHRPGSRGAGTRRRGRRRGRPDRDEPEHGHRRLPRAEPGGDDTTSNPVAGGDGPASGSKLGIAADRRVARRPEEVLAKSPLNEVSAYPPVCLVRSFRRSVSWQPRHLKPSSPFGELTGKAEDRPEPWRGEVGGPFRRARRPRRSSEGAASKPRARAESTGSRPLPSGPSRSATRLGADREAPRRAIRSPTFQLRWPPAGIVASSSAGHGPLGPRVRAPALVEQSLGALPKSGGSRGRRRTTRTKRRPYFASPWSQGGSSTGRSNQRPIKSWGAVLRREARRRGRIPDTVRHSKMPVGVHRRGRDR